MHWGPPLSGPRDMEASIQAERHETAHLFFRDWGLCPRVGWVFAGVVLAFFLLTCMATIEQVYRTSHVYLGTYRLRRRVRRASIPSLHVPVFMYVFHPWKGYRLRSTLTLDPRFRRALHTLVSLSLLDSGFPHAGISPAARLRLMPRSCRRAPHRQKLLVRGARIAQRCIAIENLGIHTAAAVDWRCVLGWPRSSSPELSPTTGAVPKLAFTYMTCWHHPLI